MKCIVPNCGRESSRSARSEGITFHKFPTDKDALEAWQKSLGLTSFNPFEDNVICSEHFHERDFCVTNYGLRKLHHDAVPVNLDPETPVAAKVCRVCFAMDSNMKDLQKYCKSFEDVTGIPYEDGDSWLPQQICWQCAAQLTTAANFRAKALLSDGLLHDLLNKETDLKFCALKPMRRVLKECGFESKFKQETFDIEHIDTYISDSSVDTQPKHNEKNYLEIDLHEIIDESVMKNNDNDDNDNIIDENVSENNDSDDKDNVIDENVSENNDSDDKDNVIDENVSENNDSDDKDNVIDKNVSENDDSDDKDNVIDENVSENNDSSNDIKNNTHEIEEHDETEFLDMYEFATSNTGKEINCGTNNFIHNAMDDIEINSDSKNVINNLIDDKKPIGNAEYYMEIQGFENNDASNDTHAYKPCQSNECPEAFNISQNQPVIAIDFRYTSNILLHSNVEDSVPFENSNEGRQYPTIDKSQFQPVVSVSNSLDHVEKAVQPNKGTAKRKGPNIDLRYARNLLKRLGHIKDPPRVKKSKKNETKKEPTRKRVRARQEDVVKDGDITVHYVRNIADCEIPAEVSQLKSSFTITPLTQDQLVQEIESRKEKAEHKFNPYKCGECYQSFPDEERYNLHMIKHDKRSGLHKCGVCKIFMKSWGALRFHMQKSHHFEFACNQCSWTSRNRFAARAHIKFHEGQTYICPHCDKIFVKSTSKLNHIRKKHPSDSVCELCGYSFISAKGIELHKRLRHRLDNLQVPEDGPLCELCNVRFVSSEAHKRHLRVSPRHHTGTDKESPEVNEPKPKRIRIPKDSREDRPLYPSQMKAEGPIPCEQCGLQLKDSRAYHGHFRQMHPDKNRTNYPSIRSPYMCEVCGKIFQNHNHLKSHTVVHTEEKPFKCEDCGKAFHMKQTLMVHRRIHSQERASYVCAQCGKHFSTAANRHRHMFIHTGLKPFKCEICEKVFKHLSEKRSHVEYVHLKKPWPKRVRGKRRPKTKQGKLPQQESNMEISTPVSPASDPKQNEMDGMMED